MQNTGKRIVLRVGTIISILLLLSVFAFSVRATVELTQAYSYGYVAQARSMCQSNDGGYMLVGQTQATNTSPTQALIIRVDSAGSMLWNRTYGGTNMSLLLGIVQTSDLGFVVAGTLNVTTEKFWLFKIDSSGNVLWENTYGGTYNEELYAMTQTNDGGYLLTGLTTSFDSGSQSDLWMVKTDSSGTAQWTQRYGTNGNDCGYGVVQTGDGGYVLTGQTNTNYCWLVRADSAGLMQWNKTFGSDLLTTRGQKLVQTNDSGYAICGYANLVQGGNNDFYLAKTDSSGNLEWNKTFGGEGQEFGRAIVKSNDGGYVLAGYTETYGAGVRDAWLVKTDSNGTMQWNQTLGGTLSDVANSLIKTSDGGYAIAGSTDSYEPTRSFFLAKVDNYGPKVATPTFNPAGGTYSSSQVVSLSCTTSGATIRYTTDGSEPNSSSTAYSGTISVSSSITIRAKAFMNGLEDSDNAVAIFVINSAIPEYPSTLILATFMVIVVAIAASFRKLRQTNLNREVRFV
jgi:hypothetical protein